MTLDELILAINEKAAKLGSQQLLAEKWGMNRPELNAVLNRKRTPSKRVLDGMGVKAVTVYEPIAKP